MTATASEGLIVPKDLKRFGQVLADVIARDYENVRQASVVVGRSHTTLYDIVKGLRRPSREVIEDLARTFPDEAVEFYDLAGLEPPASLVLSQAGHDGDPPGARHIVESGETIPLGPNVSAHGVSGGGDEFHDSIDLSSYARDLGGTYVLEVTGDCLEPAIHRGDLVVVKRARTATNGDVVVAHAMADGFTGELGDGYTLKVLRKGNSDPGFYRADGTRALSSMEAKIVGKVVGVVKRTMPSFK